MNNFTINETRKSGTHTDEEVRSLILEDNMGELRRAQYLIQKGIPIQKLSVYNNLRNLSKYSGFSILLNTIRDDLLCQDDDIIQITTTHLTSIAKQLSDKDQLFIYQLTTQFLRTLKYTNYQGWSDLFGQIYQNDIIASTKLIQELSTADDQSFRERGAHLMMYIPQIELLQLLCVDTSASVRYQTILTIQNTYRQFTIDNFNNYLGMKIYELIYDPEPFVRMAAIEMFFTIQTILNDRSKVVPKYFFEFLTSQNAQIQKVMSRICGGVFLEMQDLSIDVARFSKIFLGFSESSSEDTRINFAYNFSAILKYYPQSSGFSDTYIDSILYDNSQNVKDLLLASMPEVLKYLEPIQLLPVIKKLMVTNIMQLIIAEVVLAIDQQSQKLVLNEILKDLVKLLTCKNVNVKILQALLKLHDQFQFCDAYSTLVPTLMQLLQADAYQVRCLSSQNLAQIAYHDQNIIQAIQNACLHSKKFRMRINYIEFVSMTIDLCSKKYFQEKNLINVLSLGNDKVIDVKIKLARIMKKIDQILQDEDEHSLLLYNNTQKLLSKDKLLVDILNQYQTTILLLDDHVREERELGQVRFSMQDLEFDLTPLVRKRSSGSRQPINRTANNPTFSQRLQGRRSIPPLPKKIKQESQFKPKLNQQRLRK